APQEIGEPVEASGDDEALHAKPFPDCERKVSRAWLRPVVVVAGDRTTRDDPPERPQRGDRGLELFAPDVVEVHVDPLGERLADRVALVIEPGIEPELPGEPRDLLRRAGTADHRAAFEPCDLTGCRAHGAGGRGDEHGLTLARLADVQQPDVG